MVVIISSYRKHNSLDVGSDLGSGMVASAAAAVGGSVYGPGCAGLTHSTQHTHHTNQLTRYYPIGYAPTSPDRDHD
jgi:hypothetical protein